MKNFFTTSLFTLLLLSCTSEQADLQEKKLNIDAAQKEEVILPKNLFSVIADENALKVSEAKSKKPGDQIKVKAKVIGRTDLFVEGRAMFVVGDPEILISCDLKSGDNCSTPWDVCCMSQEDIINNTLSVQVIDDKGKVLKVSLQGKGNLDHLSHVLIEGKIAENSTSEATILNAEKIHATK